MGLRITKDTEIDIYNYHPKSLLKLASIIKDKIKDKDYNLNDICTSEITDMTGLFSMAGITKQPGANMEKIQLELKFDEWDMSNVVNAADMMSGMDVINCDITKWDLSKLEDASGMFYGVGKFNCDLSKLDVSNVKCMSSMFSGCYSFNQDLSNWDVHNCSSFTYMFSYCSNLKFDVSKWNFDSARTLTNMFYRCTNMESLPSKLPKAASAHGMYDGTNMKGKEKNIPRY